MALATRLAATRPRSRPRPAHEEHGRLARAQRLGRAEDPVVVHGGEDRLRVTGGGYSGFLPRQVGRDDEGGDAPGRTERSLDALHGVGGERVGVPRRPEPS